MPATESACPLTLRPDGAGRIVSSPWREIEGATERIGEIGGLLNDRIIPDQVSDRGSEFISAIRQDHHRDFVRRRAEQEKVGVGEFVIVERYDRTVTGLPLRIGGDPGRVMTSDGTDDSSLLPGPIVPRAGVWPR